MDLKMQFCPQSFEQRNIATAPMTKNKIGPHANAVNLPQICRQSADENFTGFFTEGLIKGNF